jgi:hypothetical protein
MNVKSLQIVRIMLYNNNIELHLVSETWQNKNVILMHVSKLFFLAHEQGTRLKNIFHQMEQDMAWSRTNGLVMHLQFTPLIPLITQWKVFIAIT